MSALFALDRVVVRRDERLVLDQADVALGAGERLGLLGANGAGKTTLLRTLIGLERPAAGTVRAFGTVCRTEPDFHPVRRRVGFLFQDPDDQLICPTVVEDVAFAPLNHGVGRRAALATARRVLDQLGLGSLAERAVDRLSGGEKRLVAFAGLIAGVPEVLLLDEPTVALDVRHQATLVGQLVAFPGAMVIATHDRSLMSQLATRAVGLREGRTVPVALRADGSMAI